jgi:Type IV secretory system Conjugative DNA transfer
VLKLAVGFGLVLVGIALAMLGSSAGVFRMGAGETVASLWRDRARLGSWTPMRVLGSVDPSGRILFEMTKAAVGALSVALLAAIAWAAGWWLSVPYVGWLAWILLAVSAVLLIGPLIVLSEAHADARARPQWATIWMVRLAGLLDRRRGAIYLGLFQHENGRYSRRPFFYAGPGHLITIGGPRVGKGAGLLVPNLSILERSAIIVDPKGEAASLTAAKRARIR